MASVLDFVEQGAMGNFLVVLHDLMTKSILLITAGLLAAVPAQARWADGCGSYGNPPCSLCSELTAATPLETQ